MGLDDGFHETETEAEAALGAAAIAAIEAAPDRGPFGDGHAGSGVGHGDDDVVAGTHGRDTQATFDYGGEGDGTAGGCVFEGVIDEVIDRLAEADRVGWALGRGGLVDDDGDGFFLGDFAVEVGGAFDEGADVEVVTIEFQHAGFGGGDIKEDFEQVEDAVGFVDAIGQRGAGFSGIAGVLQGEFGSAAEASERSAEIVREVVEGLAQDAHVRGVFVEEGVELGDEGGEFAATAGGRDPSGKVAGFQYAASGGGDGAERASGAPSEDDAGGKGEDERAGADEGEGAFQRGEEHGAAIEDTADLELPARGPLVGGDGVIAEGGLGDAFGADLLVDGEGSEGNRFDLRLDPVVREFLEKGGAVRRDEAHERRTHFG